MSPTLKQQQQQPTTNPKILFPNFNTNPTPSEITSHSQHYHTCLCCKQKNISCVYLTDTKYAPDYT